MGRRGILAEIDAERDRQDVTWGGPEHDDEHVPDNWSAFIEEHCFKALTALPHDRATYRRRMVEVAALAVAALESEDRRGVAITEAL